MIIKIKDFMWGTFNFRNKGIPIWKWPSVGYSFMKIREDSRRNVTL